MFPQSARFAAIKIYKLISASLVVAGVFPLARFAAVASFLWKLANHGRPEGLVESPNANRVDLLSYSKRIHAGYHKVVYLVR